jgi:hypothetical protein
MCCVDILEEEERWIQDKFHEYMVEEGDIGGIDLGLGGK